MKFNLRDRFEKTSFQFIIAAPNRIIGMRHEKNEEKTQGYINEGEEEEMVIHGYKEHNPYKILTWIGCIFTLGILRLVFHWWPQLMLFSTHKKCPLDQATKLLVIDNFEKRFKLMFVKNVSYVSNMRCGSIESYIYKGENTIKNGKEPTFSIHLADGHIKECTELRVVNVKKITYVWDQDKFKFIRLVGLDNGLKLEEFSQFKGYTSSQQKLKQKAYGLNEIIVPIMTIPALVVLEILNPFYCFQAFALAVWISDQYYYYSVAIIIMSVFGISSSVIQTHRNQKHLYDTIHSTDIITVKRGDYYEEIPTSSLVPGDIIVIPRQGCNLHCDAILLNGNCIVNESMLTGESVPVTKTYLPKSSKVYNVKQDDQHTLFCGTTVIQTRYYGNEKVHALVIRTGFLTAKGNLVRSILYPPPADFKFDQDSYKFIWVLALIGLLGFLYTIYIKTSRGMGIFEIVIKSLDIFTIVIPVALPAAMTVGKIHALSRLKSQKISCINSRVINVSGSIDCVCFDKTGTLTEDGLDMWGVVPVNDKYFGTPLHNPDQTSNTHLLRGMASCHSLTLIDGKYCGDPLDTKVFESTKWIIQEPTIPDETKYDLLAPTVVKPLESDKIEIGILHQFSFSSDLQRMSVITRILGNQDLILYCKGSPEMIVSLSNPETVPSNFMSKLREYTEQGYRVIALGWKKLENINYHKLEKLKREDAEKDLNFVGLIVLENRLKRQTIPTIEVLKQAKVKIIMITGDNIQTAESVARESGIISQFDTTLEISVAHNEKTEFFYTKVPHRHDISTISQKFTKDVLDHGDYKIAMTGQVWAAMRQYWPEVLPKLVYKSVVFARMASEQKQQVIVELQKMGYYVAMCGDGANDCGALKAAHVGISLSEAEASVASPFTSQEQNISCVPVVIKEGRAALVTSFGVFKFMILYSLNEFFSTLFLYRIDTNVTDFQFLFIDIALVVNFAYFFGRCKAYKGALVSQTPMTSMLNGLQILSLLFQITISAIIQISSFYIVRQYLWFEPFQYHRFREYKSYENYAVYTVSQFQYITSAVVFSQGPPYRQPVYTNKIFFCSILIMTCICAYITVTPANWVISIFELRYPPTKEFPIIVTVLGFVHFAAAMFFEDFVINFFLFKKLKWGVRSKKMYSLLEKHTQCHS